MSEKIDTYPRRKNNLTTHACVDPKMKVSNSMQLATYLQLLSSGAHVSTHHFVLYFLLIQIFLQTFVAFCAFSVTLLVPPKLERMCVKNIY